MTETMTAAELAASIGGAERAARIAARETYAAIRAAEDAKYAAQRAHDDARAAYLDRSAELRELLRALANRAETEPHTIEPEYRRPDGDLSVTYGATFGRVVVNVHPSTPGYSSKARPMVATAYAHPTGGEGGRDLYRSEHGTSDPAKLQAEVQRADAIAQEAARAMTGAAWLRAHGIDPETAPDPVELLGIEAGVKYHGATYWNGATLPAYWTPTWFATLRATGEPVAGGGLSIDGTQELAEIEHDMSAGRREYGGAERYEAARALAVEVPAEATEAEVQAIADQLAPRALAAIVWGKL